MTQGFGQAGRRTVRCWGRAGAASDKAERRLAMIFLNSHMGWGELLLYAVRIVVDSLFTLKTQDGNGSAYSGVDDHWFPL